MKVLRGFLVVFLVLIIVGGLGYIVYDFFLMPMNHGSTSMGNMPGMNNQGTNAQNGTNSQNNAQQNQNNQQMPGTQTPQNQNNQQMPGMQTPQNQNAAQQPASSSTYAPLNTIAVQNKDKLNSAISTINQAIDMMSIDPYAKATIPSTDQGMAGSMQTQQNPNTGAVYVFPSGSSTVNVVPPSNNSPNNMTSSTNNNMGAMTGQQNTNYVYDQGKLQQLNNGIYAVAQGLMAINQLNDDLAAQSATVESNPPNYQTYVVRYNTALQNRTKLNSAISMIDRASTLVNVNPYASPAGYQIKVTEMQSLHNGLFKLAQGMTMLNRLNEDFTLQMAQAAGQAQALANNMNNMSGMNMSGMNQTLSLSSIINIVIIVLVIGLVLGIFGAIVSLFRKKPRTGGGSEPNTL